MNLQQFINKWLGKGIDFDGHYGFQCVDLYRQYAKEVWQIPQSPGVEGAADIWTSYLKDYVEAIKNTSELIPQPGDVCIWNRRMGGGFGHVAVVIEATLNRMKVLEQDGTIRSVVQIKEYPYTNVLGFLRIKNQTGGVPSMPEDQISIQKSTFEELVTKSSKYDEFNRAGYENAQKLIIKLDELDQSLKQSSEEKKKAEAQAELYRKQLNEVVSELAKALDTRQDIPEIINEAQKSGKIAELYEDLNTQYINDKKSWGNKESDLNAEINRLQALLKYEDVLSNAKLGDLIKEIINRLLKIKKGE